MSATLDQMMADLRLEELHHHEKDDVVVKQYSELVDAFLAHLEPNSFTPPNDLVSSLEQRADLGRVALRLLQCSTGQSDAQNLKTLHMLLVLSRDAATGKLLGELEDGLTVRTLLHHSGLAHFAAQSVHLTSAVEIPESSNPAILVIALKALSNVLFLSESALQNAIHSRILQGIMNRILTYSDPDLCEEVKFLDARLLFYVTVKSVDQRRKLRYEMHGLSYLSEALELLLTESRGSSASDNVCTLSSRLVSELLKVLWNLASDGERLTLPEEELAHFQSLVSHLAELLLRGDITDETRQHTVNLLMLMPREAYEELLTPSPDGDISSEPAALQETWLTAMPQEERLFEGYRIDTVLALVRFLEIRLDTPARLADQSSQERLCPILTLLTEACNANRIIRRCAKAIILPPLERNDVMRLPEEGESLRNKLCRLLTNVDCILAELAASFIYIMCKKSVNRSIKHTGYGNFAGFLARGGLMVGGGGGGGLLGNDAFAANADNANEARFSSDSSDSECEDLMDVNPVTGRAEMPRPDPTSNMTEEEKEYHAHQLVQAIDRLQRSGVIQPGVIGSDGRPRAAEHTLELLETLSKSSHNDGVNEEDDSDDENFAN